MSKSTLNAQSQEAVAAHLEECMRRTAQKRDKAAFGELFDHYAPLLRAYSLAREPGAMLVADELAQTVLVKVWNKAQTFDKQKASLNTWIYTLARNSRIDMLRRNSRYTMEIDPEFLWAEEVDEQADPFVAVQQKRAEDTIANAFQHLPIEQQEVLTKVYLEGKSHQESAEELKLPLGTVKSRIRLAIQKLQVLVGR
ncbi:ECF RNA polymerase sigma factor RpoE [Thalassocella blandensis]|nr:ECF RNA polymerase sigma factor RpoE [Thalassocella blandensis]